MSRDNHVFRLKPLHYLHVLDNNTNITRVLTGPRTYTRQEHEEIVCGPVQMIMIRPRHYCVIENPVVRDENGEVMLDEAGNYRLKHSDLEIRFAKEKEPIPGVPTSQIYEEPFPLYPGEKLSGAVTALQVVAPNTAIRLRAVRDVQVGDKQLSAGEEYLFHGPGTLVPQVGVTILKAVPATIIQENQALKLRAMRQCIDHTGQERQSGDEWLVRTPGAYLPNVDETVVELVAARVLTEKVALHMQALVTFTVGDVTRSAGEEWLVTLHDADSYIPDVYERVVGEVHITTLNSRQYCYVLNPVGEDGLPQLGKKELRRGEISFFLQPGEKLESGVRDVEVLPEETSLLLRAREAFTDTFGPEPVDRQPGERWSIRGPADYVPPVEVEVLDHVHSIPLDENEGVYVRDTHSGKVRAVFGESYMLKPTETLWEKELSDTVEDLLRKGAFRDAPDRQREQYDQRRDRTRVVSYRAPHNSAVQVYDYKAKVGRVVFGPDLVLLGPDEEFTVISLSAGKPKKEGAITALSLMLGPDFMTDVLTVETADHARLQLQLAYNWHFDVKSLNDPQELFSVPDFVGDAAKAIASRVRGAVAGAPFDLFHRKSSEIITSAVFGKDPETGEPRERLYFPQNHLVVTNIDIQSVEPIDQRTRDALQKSVQLAIEITTKSQEAFARHKAQKSEQLARGNLEIHMIRDEAAAEKEKQELLRLRAHTESVKASGQATAEARARAEAAEIEAQAAVEQSALQAKAMLIDAEAELDQLMKQQEQEIEHKRALNALEVNRARDEAKIESEKFRRVVEAITPEAIASIAAAGPEMQAKLLGGLGLESVLITNGSSPVSLFSTAQGMISTTPK
mmetsp:Transcript_16165/g.41513  ORF Transcript_16165/g.41513 Transcript_16165/m.41513 type:complete len:851 (+) Transcript_16165:218-2770(+)|eukprot:CAMPEP_0177654920 /NCGR_PEP_ID=MMETSP0447-20121125/14631_1 /TAXON_ID=0 /ORGANISM="Stygamoeba regulata, Strain BSH-02190019" /LENGTH=850 /DNA_ID=CAMNT_0019158685 /DNA_START=217 /DNA_END=2769 /DNA_ORIENTATION=+